jgi:hypothetical protein
MTWQHNIEVGIHCHAATAALLYMTFSTLVGYSCMLWPLSGYLLSVVQCSEFTLWRHRAPMLLGLRKAVCCAWAMFTALWLASALSHNLVSFIQKSRSFTLTFQLHIIRTRFFFKVCLICFQKIIICIILLKEVFIYQTTRCQPRRTQNDNKRPNLTTVTQCVK